MKEHTQEPGRTASGNNAHEHGNCNLCDDLERQLEEAQLAYRVTSTMLDEVVVERDEAQGRLRKANCDYGDGWLSDDLECQVDVEPWCGKHAVLYYIRANKEAQGKLEAIQALTLEPGHAVVDHITWHNALHRILRGSKEDTPELTNC